MIKILGVALAAVLGAAAPASALSLAGGSDNCTVGGVTSGSGFATAASLSCAGVYIGTGVADIGTASTLNDRSFSGITNWQFTEELTFTSGTVSDANSEFGNTRWSFGGSFGGVVAAVVELVLLNDGATTAYSAFYELNLSPVNGADSDQGSYNFTNLVATVQANGQTAAGKNAVDRILIYTADAATTPVPVPAAGVLLIGALGGLALFRRRPTVA